MVTPYRQTTAEQDNGPAELCAKIPLADAVRIFCAESAGGLLQRTTRWPRPDSHEEARRMCGRCPALEDCLTQAMTTDEVTFRGLSPEERAVFGGARGKAARKRPPYLTVAEVVQRIVESGYDLDAVFGALAAHDAARCASDDPDTAEGVIAAGWSENYRGEREPVEWAATRMIRHD